MPKRLREGEKMISPGPALLSTLVFSAMASTDKSALLTKTEADKVPAEQPQQPRAGPALPSAAEMAERSQKAPARREREQGRDARQARTQRLLTEFADHLEARTNAKVPEAVDKGYGYTRIGSWRPPTKEKGEDGQRYYKYDAHLTHFAGLSEDGEPLPAEEGGIPIAQLLQGVLKRGSRKPDPKALPGGKTSATILAERLADRGYGVQVVFTPKFGICVYVAWDHKEFRKFLKGVQDRKAKADAEREKAAGQMSFSEYQAQQDRKREERMRRRADASGDGEGSWQTVGKGGKGKARARPRPSSEG